MVRLVCLSAAAALGFTSAAWADEHIFVYDAASDPARALAETGLSFQFEGRFPGGYKLQRIIQTGEQGSADLKPASDSDLGAGGLRRALGGEAPVGSLYEIRRDASDGQAFVDAVCPGAARAWLVVGPLKRFRDLPIQAVGRDPGASGAHHCVDLKFTFRSELSMPADRTPPPEPVEIGREP